MGRRVLAGRGRVRFDHGFVPGNGETEKHVGQGRKPLGDHHENDGAAKRGIAKLGLDATEAMQEEMWVRVKRDAMRSNHTYKEEIADLVDFVRNLSGGVVEPIYIYYLRNFIRTLQVERKVRGGLDGLLARVQIGVPNAAPQFRLACLQAMVGASDTHGSISRGKTKQIVPLHLAVVGRAISA